MRLHEYVYIYTFRGRTVEVSIRVNGRAVGSMNLLDEEWAAFLKAHSSVTAPDLFIAFIQAGYQPG